MTACVNNEKEIKGGVSGKVLRTVAAGVLAMSMMPAAALAVEPADAETLAATTDINQPSWSGVEFTWNVDADKWGNYSVEAGEQFFVTSAKDVYGDPVSASDYQVIYVLGTTAYKVVPETPGDYTAYLIEGGLPAGFQFDADGKINMSNLVDVDGEGEETTTQTLTAWLTANADKIQTQEFAVTPLSLEGAFAFDDTIDGNVADKTFKAGTTFAIAFADADGNELTAGTNNDYTVTWLKADGTVFGTTAPTNAEPGSYTAVLKGEGKYAGSVEEAKVVIDAIDLQKDSFTIKPVTTNQSAFGNGVLKQFISPVYVNGEKLDTNVVTVTAISRVNPDGTVTTGSYNGNIGKVNAEVTAASTGYFVSGTSTSTKTPVSVLVVEKDVAFEYDKDAFNDGDSLGTFVTSKGEKFDPTKFTAEVADGAGTKKVPLDYSVTKNGDPVTSYDEAGTYTVTVTAEAPANTYEYAGSETYTFDVVSAQVTEQPKVYATIDGKDAEQPVEYTGSAVEPRIIAKDGKTTLLEGTDYVVTIADAKGNAVESVVEPGVYTYTVDFLGAVDENDNAVDNVEFDVTVEKAQLRSAVSDKSVYAYTGEAVEPTFTAYNKENLSGLSVEIDPAVTGVTYHEYELVGKNNQGNTAQAGETIVSYVWDEVRTLKASELKEPGFYTATVNAPVDDAHFKGDVESDMFEISKTAGFSDVSSSDWFADAVYKAKDLGYISGIQGTNLFAPNTDIDRAQIAAIMFNMGGGYLSMDDQNDYPTKFSDVDQAAWYAKAVSWASTYGVVNGYAGTDLFGTFDKATREQVATMFYNYAKAMGQDVAVEDVDAALAKVDDAYTVSDWAKPAVAWAIENGIMGNGGSIWAQNNITRAEVAAMAVNLQPEAL